MQDLPTSISVLYAENCRELEGGGGGGGEGEGAQGFPTSEVYYPFLIVYRE